MEGNNKLFSDIGFMEPLYPTEDILENLAVELIEKSARLSGVLNPITRSAIADFLRPMNSYYSNLIEGHDTHPIDIDKALNNNYSDEKDKRNLQLEAKAHIDVFKEIAEMFADGNSVSPPTSIIFLKEVHKRFYSHLPVEFKESKSKSGENKIVEPGFFRTCEVQVGRHIAPDSRSLDAFMERFESFYNPENAHNKSKVRRIISIGAAHHRLAWVHPFLDGNGRVIRLFSDAFFMHENLDASGLWSISRGLARSSNEYKSRLANADLERISANDGRGHLSNRYLVEFCEFFMQAAIDQIDFMYQSMDVENMLKRIESFVDLMVFRGKMKPVAKHILVDVFLKGKISKTEAVRITGTSEKTLKLITDSLIEQGLLRAVKEGISMMYYVRYPISFSPIIFPGLYPSDKEVDMLNNI